MFILCAFFCLPALGLVIAILLLSIISSQNNFYVRARHTPSLAYRKDILMTIKH